MNKFDKYILQDLRKLFWKRRSYGIQKNSLFRLRLLLTWTDFKWKLFKKSIWSSTVRKTFNKNSRCYPRWVFLKVFNKLTQNQIFSRLNRLGKCQISRHWSKEILEPPNLMKFWNVVIVVVLGGIWLLREGLFDDMPLLVQAQTFWIFTQPIALCSYRKQLGISKILKSNGPDFAKFWFKFDNFTFGWCKSVKRL